MSYNETLRKANMFRKKQQPREITPAERFDIIEEYLKQNQSFYHNQDITAERMIEMEIELIARLRTQTATPQN